MYNYGLYRVLTSEIERSENTIDSIDLEEGCNWRG